MYMYKKREIANCKLRVPHYIAIAWLLLLATAVLLGPPGPRGATATAVGPGAVRRESQ